MEDHTLLSNGHYIRIFGHLHQINLAKIISKSYLGKESPRQVCLFPSGMAATAITLLSVAQSYKERSRILFSSELYPEIISKIIPLIESFTPHKCVMVDIWDKIQLQEALMDELCPQYVCIRKVHLIRGVLSHNGISFQKT